MTYNNKSKDTEKYKTGRWTRAQHNKFMQAFEKYGRRWILVQKKIKTRSLLQIRSHAQKVFLNMHEKDIDALIDHQSASNLVKPCQIKKISKCQISKLNFYENQNNGRKTNEENNQIKNQNSNNLNQNNSIMSFLNFGMHPCDFSYFSQNIHQMPQNISNETQFVNSPTPSNGNSFQINDLQAQKQQNTDNVVWTPIIFYSYQI